MTGSPSRRSVVLAATGVAGALAGCLNVGGGGGDGPTDETEARSGGGGDAGSTTASDADGTGGTGEDGTGEDGSDGGETSGELDLREANVTGVELSSRGDGEVRFSVTLYHDDEGEEGYANRWTVETRDGEELGRRELLHAHGTREFTRSETVSLPNGVECVVVRGHDETHGYGGQAALVSVSSGATRFVAQGSEPSSFADATCP